MRTRPPALVLLCLATLGARPIAAQGGARTPAPTGPRPVDRILAIVGSKPILASQVEEQLALAQSQGAKIPDDSAGRDAARHQILAPWRSEEHTSELQSRPHLVCRLLLEKKKQSVTGVVSRVHAVATNEELR